MKTITLSYPTSLEMDDIPNALTLAIGDFDGIHLGHQQVIRRAILTARQMGIVSAVMTFDPHPRTVLGRSEYKHLLTPLSEKLEQFERLGADYAFVVRFSPAFASLLPEQFVNDLLIPMNTKAVMVGFDFRFGHQGVGDADSLCKLGEGRFAVEVVRPYHLDGIKVSSTAIRDMLAAGEVDKALKWLGRPYMLRGTVVSGDKRGRTIGFPTANIQLDEPFLCPQNGVYAVRVLVTGVWIDGVMNIGTKPTFSNETKQTLEAHLFDFDQNIYGDQLTIQFISFIRKERKFDSIPQLIEQISRDSEHARKQLSIHT